MCLLFYKNIDQKPGHFMAVMSYWNIPFFELGLWSCCICAICLVIFFKESSEIINPFWKRKLYKSCTFVVFLLSLKCEIEIDIFLFVIDEKQIWILNELCMLALFLNVHQMCFVLLGCLSLYHPPGLCLSCLSSSLFPLLRTLLDSCANTLKEPLCMDTFSCIHGVGQWHW